MGEGRGARGGEVLDCLAMKSVASLSQASGELPPAPRNEVHFCALQQPRTWTQLRLGSLATPHPHPHPAAGSGQHMLRFAGKS